MKIEEHRLFLEYVLCDQHNDDIMILVVFRSTTDLWPFFVISLCLAMVIGSIVWSMETWNNEKQFARQFYVGVLDGFWWWKGLVVCSSLVGS